MTAAIFIIFCLIFLAYDLLYRRVPNWLLLVALVIHVGWMVIAREGFGGIDPWHSLIGGALGFALFIPLYALRVMGAGDVKFFALLGMTMGPYNLIPLWLIGSVLAGIHAAVWYLLTKSMVAMSATWQRIKTAINSSATYQRLLERRAGRHGIPYAAYLAVAAIAIGVS